MSADVSAREVLVIEDDPDLLEFMCLGLQQAGFVVTSVTSGPEAKKHLARGPELVVMDWNVPGISGMELVSSVLERCKEPRVVVVSGAASEEIPLDFAGGRFAYLRKPFRPYELPAVLAALVAAS